MSEQDKKQSGGDEGTCNAVPVKPRRERLPRQSPPRVLPPWKVILHNDDVNEMNRVVEVICLLTRLNRQEAAARMEEAHKTGAALLLVTHRERAELYVEQFATYNLTVTAEPEVG
ncbi:MAG TPA: ATP-dependent Clp protease adaptor ClpS [Phycisphaerae bacterium]|nr:ATP-dependent Clp protease adaptor ClpS [Phycisphaerae bacterium]HRR84624.1 ATP-dependent Clp protease adaptor ClpS [Phycisphaerae bacterium]